MKKEFEFVVTLAHPGRRWIMLIANLMVVLAAGLLSFILLNTGQIYSWKALMPALILLLGFFTFFEQRSGNPISHRWVLSLSAVFLIFVVGNWLISLGYVIAAGAIGAAAINPEVGFTREGITINNLFPTKKGWQEINNAMIKDDVLTIDFTSNHLYQKTLNDPISRELTLEFNQFCQECLAAKPNRRASA